MCKLAAIAAQASALTHICALLRDAARAVRNGPKLALKREAMLPQPWVVLW